MRFPYLAYNVGRPVHPLGGSMIRHYPVFNVRIVASGGGWLRDCLMDTGADDTVFPVSAARALGIDLRSAAVGHASPFGGAALTIRYAPVTLRVSDGLETFEWSAIVGFIAAHIRWPLLGRTGFLDVIDAALYGARREVVLTPNADFTGSHTIH
jgi:hypothetical protein